MEIAEWFSNYSAAIQAGASVAIATLTVVLIYVTSRYVRLTQQILEVNSRDSAIRLAPKLVLLVTAHVKENVARGSLRIKNKGENPAVLVNVKIDGYCSHSEQTNMRPTDFPLLTWRLMPPEEELDRSFEISLQESDMYHAPHEGKCNWVFRAEVQCRDMLHLLRHVYSFDQALGHSHFVEPPSVRSTWWRRQKRFYRNVWSKFVHKTRRALQRSS